MALDFESIAIEITDTLPGDGTFRWVEVALRFRDTTLDFYPKVVARVWVESDLSRSIGELRQQASDQTKTILRETLAQLEAHGPEGLARMESDRESRKAERNRRFLETGVMEPE